MGMMTDLSAIPGALPDADRLLAMMGQDKKVVDGRVRFILARGIVDDFVGKDVPHTSSPGYSWTPCGDADRPLIRKDPEKGRDLRRFHRKAVTPNARHLRAA